MNTQEIGFSEIMQIIVLIFFAALLLGFILTVGKLIYEFIIFYINKKEDLINYKYESQKLIGELVKSEYINHLDIYKGHNEKDKDWDHYYQITGRYKDNRFLICISKKNGFTPKAEIRIHVTDEARQFQDFLKTLTPLTFIIS
jgi:hypothetical protein